MHKMLKNRKTRELNIKCDLKMHFFRTSIVNIFLTGVAMAKGRGYVACIFCFFWKDTYSILAYVNKNRIRCNYIAQFN